MRNIVRAIVATATLGAVALPAFAQQTARIGEAIHVVNEVRAEYERDRRDLQRGDEVHQNELIEVGAESIGELVLADQTKLALGPGSRLLLDKFVYNGERANGDIVLDLVRGTFRFITGVASRNSYRIRTPGVAITVRGTVFDVFIADDRAIWLLLMEGAIRACNDRGDCRNLDRPGQILRISPRGDLERPATWAAIPQRARSVPFDTAFPFVVAAPIIDPTPALSRDVIVTGRLPTPPKQPPSKTPPRQRDTGPSKPPRTREASTPPSSPNPGLGVAIGIGVGIGIGSAIGGGGNRGPNRPPSPPPRQGPTRKY